jgi:hypothetical protein
MQVYVGLRKKTAVKIRKIQSIATDQTGDVRRRRHSNSSTLCASCAVPNAVLTPTFEAMLLASPASPPPLHSIQPYFLQGLPPLAEGPLFLRNDL